MGASLAHAAAPRHLLRSEMRPKPAKADLRKAENVEFHAVIGACIDRARLAVGWNLNEFADAVRRDTRQVKRWIDGVERPQFDALFAVAVLRGPLVIELARLSEDIEVETTIRVRRTA